MKIEIREDGYEFILDFPDKALADTLGIQALRSILEAITSQQLLYLEAGRGEEEIIE